MKFTIVHLYHDLLNLYGASGNLKVLSHYLSKQGIEVEIRPVSLNEFIDFDVDMIYLASGTEESLELARVDILKYKNQIKDFIDQGKFIYAEGNSIELFTNSINEKEALSVYDYDVVYHERVRKEVDFISSLIDERIYGFVNCYSLIEKNEDLVEYGFVKKNLIASYLLGPIFARNPYLCEWYVKKIMNYLSIDAENVDFDNILDHQAYTEFIELLNN